MSGTARSRHFAEFMRSMYPAFSRRATQVCVMSSALERIATGAPDAQTIARTALEQANPFGWNERPDQHLNHEVPQPAIRYDVLSEYADKHRLHFNDLCRVVREAVTGVDGPDGGQK